ncbi:hypothetical protein B484DRAFT_173231 [Ochromonadaceae sp. CCMP2298]|nr:hypothetical protein B484DRAFT_173231 [Ochromonadaceae sp. CCMP2298]
MEKAQTSLYAFSATEAPMKCLSSRDRKDQLVQYNLDQNLKFFKFRFTGATVTTASDYEQLLVDLLTSTSVLKTLAIDGAPALPMQYSAQQLKISVMKMGFFDKLDESDIVGPGGTIKGCFDEVVDGLTVGDTLREMLANSCSERADLFSTDEQAELIFQLFKIVAVGGTLCQTESTVDRYLDITRDIYKELVTIYKDSKTETVQFAGRAYVLQSAKNLTLFPDNPESPHNRLLLLVDPLKKTVTVVKNSFKPFW